MRSNEPACVPRAGENLHLCNTTSCLVTGLHARLLGVSSGRDIGGEVLQYEVPDWQPLHALVGIELAVWFTWMFEIALDDGRRVHTYKHIPSRTYLHLAVDGKAFVYLRRGSYREIDRRQALALALDR